MTPQEREVREAVEVTKETIVWLKNEIFKNNSWADDKIAALQTLITFADSQLSAQKERRVGVEEIKDRLSQRDFTVWLDESDVNKIAQAIADLQPVRGIDVDKIADVLDTELPWLREDLLKLAQKIKDALIYGKEK